MFRINLLPYRKEWRQKQIIQHLSYIVGAVFVVGLIVVGLNFYITGELTDLQEEKASLQRQNAQLTKKIGDLKNLDKLRADVEGKLALVDQLQEGRFETLNMLHELAQIIPENVWFSSAMDSSGRLQFTGYAESNKAVANFMRALDQSSLFEDISLQVIQRKDINGIPVRSFSLSLKRSAPKNVKKKGRRS